MPETSESLRELVNRFLKEGGKIQICPPQTCVFDWEDGFPRDEKGRPVIVINPKKKEMETK